MTAYSYSKISCFENCPFQYKLKYIDRIKIEIPNTIEAFMGGLVHKTLEKMYLDKKFSKDVSKEILLNFYNELWEKEYSDDILIVKNFKAENYKKMGAEYISKYFDRYKRDDFVILGLETQDRMTLPDGNQWHVRIDKLVCDSDGNYYVCDYKTNARLKSQEEADSDRQLAMYSIWVKDRFKDARSVKLVWHMLAFDKDVVSERTMEQEKKLQEDVIQLIKQIQKAEQENNFPRKQSGLCDYCLYKSLCPSFKHLFETKELTKEKFKDLI